MTKARRSAERRSMSTEDTPLVDLSEEAQIAEGIGTSGVANGLPPAFASLVFLVVAARILRLLVRGGTRIFWRPIRR